MRQHNNVSNPRHTVLRCIICQPHHLGGNRTVGIRTIIDTCVVRRLTLKFLGNTLGIRPLFEDLVIIGVDDGCFPFWCQIQCWPPVFGEHQEEVFATRGHNSKSCDEVS